MAVAKYAIEAVDACPVCRSKERRPLHAGLTDVTMGAFPGDFSFVECGRCRSAYLDPRPTPESLGHAYAGYPTHVRPQTQAGLATSVLGRLRQSVTGAYRDVRFRGRAGVASRILAAPLYAFPGRRREVDNVVRFLPSTPGRLLDYGCGGGAFLDLARTYGWEVEGVDFDEEVLRVCRADGLQVSRADEFDTAQNAGRFDAVTLAHVLEHVPDPSALLASLHTMLKPGGHLYIELPNPDAVGHRIYRSAWRGLEVPRHFSLPTIPTLTGLLARIGFDDVKLHRRHVVFADMARRSEEHEPATLRSLTEHASRIAAKIRARFTSGATEFTTITCIKAC